MFHYNQYLIIFSSIGFLPYFYPKILGYELGDPPELNGRFIVSIQDNTSRHLCNGVIVNESFVISSEHCVKNASDKDNFDHMEVYFKT